MAGIAVLIFILIFKVVSNLLKSLVYFLILFLIVSVIFGFFFTQDLVAFTTGIKNEQKIFLLKDNQTILTGFEMIKINETTSISKEDLLVYSELYKSGDYDKLLGKRFKVFMIEIASLEDKNTTIANFLKGRNVVIEEFRYEPDAKNAAFVYLITKRMAEDPMYILTAYKQGFLTVYPETLVFKSLKLLMR